jgi:hypothetical protein
MRIQVSIQNGEVIFRFDKPARFDVFLVSDAARQVHWELRPSYMHPASVSDSFMAGVAVPSPIADLIPRRNGAPSAEEEAVPRVSVVRYGIAPSGYREIAAARALEEGKTYAVLVFDDTGDSEVVQFSV